MGHARRGQVQVGAFDHGPGGHVPPVRPRHFQQGGFLSVPGGQGLIRQQRHHAAFNFPADHPGGGFPFLAVDFLQGQPVQPLPHHPLVGGMDIVKFPLVQEADHAGVPHPVPHPALAQPQGGPGFAVRRAFFNPHGQLHEQEGQGFLLEGAPPPVDEGGHQHVVLLRAAGVLLPLIIQDAREGQGDQGLDHGGVQPRRPVGRGRSRRGIPGAGADFRHQVVPEAAGMRRLPGRHFPVPFVQLLPEGFFLLQERLQGHVLRLFSIFLQIPPAFPRPFQPVLVHPAGDGGAPQIGVDDAHRHPQLPLQLHGEKVGGGAHVLRPAGAHGVPPGLPPGGRPLLAEVSELGHVEVADHGIHVAGDQGLALVRVLQLQLHIALSARQIDLPDGNIQGGEGFALRRHQQPAARLGLLGRQENQEAPVPGLRISPGQQPVLPIPQLAVYLRPVRRLAEEAQLLAAAEHRAVRKQRGHLQHVLSPPKPVLPRRRTLLPPPGHARPSCSFFSTGRIRNPFIFCRFS